MNFTLQMALVGACSVFSSVAAIASEVSIRESPTGHFSLLRNGQPYVIHGAGGTEHLTDLAKLGGNSIRTWGIDTLAQTVDGKPLLDRCQELGITVTAGIWVGHARHGFDYSDPLQLERQRTAVREAVLKYRDHPALLLWGLGNEMEGPESDGKDPRIWKELNILAGIVKKADLHHPVMTVIAGAGDSKIQGILTHYPAIDILGVNAYASAAGALASAKRSGWKKPFILTEFGPQGHWEVAKTTWGAPVEPSSWAKAASYYATLSLLGENADLSVGSYVFLWGHKQEVTPTWYSMFLPTGEKLPSVDAVSRVWTGKWPANRSPKILKFETVISGATVAPDTIVPALATPEDPEHDPLTWEWIVSRESSDPKSGGDAEAVPPPIPGAILSQADGKASIRTPHEPGAYRLFVIVRDGKGGASEDNVPFHVGD